MSLLTEAEIIEHHLMLFYSESIEIIMGKPQKPITVQVCRNSRLVFPDIQIQSHMISTRIHPGKSCWPMVVHTCAFCRRCPVCLIRYFP